jgi:hypothetical protein
MEENWTPSLIDSITDKLELTIHEAVLKIEEDSELKTSFISDVNLLESEAEEDDEGYLVYEKLGEEPEQQSENLRCFLEYIGADDHEDDIIDLMELEEFETSSMNSGFDLLESDAKGELYCTFAVSYQAVADYLNQERVKINEEVYNSFIKDYFSE